jgi:hypothetical protein
VVARKEGDAVAKPVNKVVSKGSAVVKPVIKGRRR